MDLQPFVKCLKPKVITNKYTKERVIVKCGKCSACLNFKAMVNTQRCQLESLQHRYTYMITLTYAPEFVPLGMFFKSPMSNMYYFNVISARVKEQLEDETLFICNEEEYQEYLKVAYPKINTTIPYSIPFLFKRDIQLFLKRLRKYFPNDSLRYFLSGEYGEERFRAHYHLELWFENEETAKNLEQALYSSWTYGNIDFSEARENAASYVASYINSFGNLPALYRKPSIKPFSVHSRFLAQQLVKDNFKEHKVYHEWCPDRLNVYQSVDRISLPLNGKYRDIVLWRSLEAQYYPRCSNYFNKSDEFRLFSYRMYEKIRIWSQETSAFRQSKILTTIIAHYHSDYYDTIPKEIQDIVFYFISKIECCDRLISCYDDKRHNLSSYYVGDDYVFHVQDLLSKIQQSIYRELYISKLFYDAKTKLNLDSYSFLKRINDYYSLKELQNYSRQVATYESFINYKMLVVPAEDARLWSYFFPDSFDELDFLNEDFYSEFKDNHDMLHESKTKYKKQNDLNNVLG